MGAFGVIPRFVSFLLLVALTSELRAITLQVPFTGNQVGVYIDLLRSPDEAKRQEAKVRLLSLGAESIGPLLALLEDLFRNEFMPRFALGRETEGKEAWDHYQALEPRKINERQLALQRLDGLEISSRLKDDAIELLGHLRAKEGVPLLIRIMEGRSIDNAWEKARSEM